ncbi:MAG: Ig-like domain-containing protein [Dehalococcoidia bacterium]|jgi:hypothetical protein
MKKFAILAGLMSLALVIGVAGTSLHQNGKAEANATDAVAFNPDVCAGLTHLGLGARPVQNPCYDLMDPAALAEVAAFFDGDVNDPATYKDLVDASNAQVGESSEADPSTLDAPILPNSQAMWVLTFVSNDDNISYTAEQGVWLSSGNQSTGTTNDELTPKSTFTGCPLNADATADADCDTASGTTGDGVVVDLLYSGKTPGNPDSTPVAPVLTPAKLDRGSATIQIFQSTDSDEQDIDYTVVGLPDNLSLKSLKDTIQEDSGAPCTLGGYSTNEFTQENLLPDVSGMLATVTDTDGTDLTGILVSWQSADISDIKLAADGRPNPLPAPSGTDLGLVPTLFKSDQASAPNLACGGDTDTGIKISAAVGIDDFNGHAIVNGAFATAGTLIDDNTKIDVVAAPANLALTADPTSIVCDGVNSSTVTATVTGSDGKPVVVGNQVRFDVVALGTASPITATTVDKGIATSKVTPLSGVTAGVTADVTVRTIECVGSSGRADCFPSDLSVTVDDTKEPVFDTDCLNPCKTEQNSELDNLEQTILVSCQPAVPIAPPAAPPGGAVTPPKTGDGGYLP